MTYSIINPFRYLQSPLWYFDKQCL
jgi:hypothetical protein